VGVYIRFLDMHVPVVARLETANIIFLAYHMHMNKACRISYFSAEAQSVELYSRHTRFKQVYIKLPKLASVCHPSISNLDG
jgi:hypothetical protein